MRTVFAAALCVAAFAASAQVYRWTDDQGRVHITDTPPPASAKDVRKSGDAPAAAAPPRAGAPEPYALQQARTKYPITLYTTPGCDACADARKLLNARGLPFSEISVTENAQIEELKRISGSASVPAIVIGSTVQRGFESGTYQGLLDAAGYPATGSLPPRSQAEPVAPPPGAREVKPAAEPERPTGPYAPGAASKPEAKK